MGRAHTTEKLTAEDAQNIRGKKAAVNRETYKIIYQTILKTIRTAAEFGKTNTRCIIPGYILGRPKINTKHAMRYCHDKLVMDKYKVYVDQTQDGIYTLFIDWLPEIKQKTYVKPIPNVSKPGELPIEVLNSMRRTQLRTAGKSFR